VTISWPSTTSPKMVWLPVSQGVAATVMKNWQPLVSGAGVGHGQLAGLVELVRRAFGLVLEAVAGSAHAGAGGIAALDHEVGNDAMEDGAVEELVGGLGAGGGVGPLLAPSASSMKFLTVMGASVSKRRTVILPSVVVKTA
jgi:hypothetical protein